MVNGGIGQIGQLALLTVELELEKDFVTATAHSLKMVEKIALEIQLKLLDVPCHHAPAEAWHLLAEDVENIVQT